MTTRQTVDTPTRRNIFNSNLEYIGSFTSESQIFEDLKVEYPFIDEESLSKIANALWRVEESTMIISLDL